MADPTRYYYNPEKLLEMREKLWRRMVETKTVPKGMRR